MDGHAKPRAGRAGDGGWVAALGRGFDHVLLALTYLAIGLLLFMGASVIYEIFMRYLFNSPTRWVVEFSEYTLLYIGLLAAAFANSGLLANSIPLVAACTLL